MRLQKRIKYLAKLVPKNCPVVDIGCDHGLLDIYLTKYNGNNCIASDIKQTALNQAINNFKRYIYITFIIFNQIISNKYLIYCITNISKH